MAWEDLAKTETDLAAALNTFSWVRASEIVGELADRIRTRTDPLPASAANRVLSSLRRKRRLAAMSALAETLMETGQGTPRVARQYAQALIDLGYLTPAEHVLDSLVKEAPDAGEVAEARGLIGRIHKQIYINNGGSPRVRPDLERAIGEYLEVYRSDPGEHLWHGINAVACAELARRDGLAVGGAPESGSVAKDILDVIGRKAQASTWDLATAMEAHLALRDLDATLKLALAYTESPDADAFEINSTLRQLTEVWGLTESKLPGSRLLPLLRAALVSKQGGSLAIDANQANADRKPEVRRGLEKVFGADRFMPLKSYQLGLQRASSVARIERANGQGHGTGWLVRGEDFFPRQKGRLLVITNHHVVSAPAYPGALLPKQAKVHFQILKLVLDVDKLVWTSPPGEYDATFLSLKTAPKSLRPLELAEAPVTMTDPAPRLHVIGHPGGRDLEFSLEDSCLVGADGVRLHYRTPTQGGSSGSPVFEDQEWTVVALHHAGKDDMPRLDGTGTYEANEGISIPAIQAATRGT